MPFFHAGRMCLIQISSSSSLVKALGVAGTSANFIILDANPLENIANTRRINKVYHRGQEVDRAALRAKWRAEVSRKTK